MTNKEKMLAGQVYDPNDKEIVSEQFEYLNAMKAYNALPYGDKREEEYLRKMLRRDRKTTCRDAAVFRELGRQARFHRRLLLQQF